MSKLSMLKQRGQIAVFAAVFVLMMGLILLTSFKTPNPADFPLTSSAKSQDGAIQCQIINDPAVLFSDTAREFSTGTPEYQDVGTAEYKLIRKNVPIEKKTFFNDSDHSEKKGTKVVNGLIFDVYYPKASGEIYLINPIESPSRGDTPLKPGVAYGRFYFIDWGLIFLVHLTGPAPNLITHDGKEYYITDIYQNTQKTAIPDEAFFCQGGKVSTRSVVFPTQNQSLDQKQLQLQYFNFRANQEGYVSNVDCKPAIYLYPKEKMEVNVKVRPKGFLTYTDPVYPEEGWNVIAYPSGKIELRTTNYELRTYDYLYYEAKIEDGEVKRPQKGYVVSFEQLPNFYYNILPKLGLNPKQMQDFVEYWKKALPYSPFYFVGIMDQDNVNNFEPLEITPKPDFINRVRLYFERLDKPIQVKEPEISNVQFQMSNVQLSVVDWGGMVKRDLNHPFTCLQ